MRQKDNQLREGLKRQSGGVAKGKTNSHWSGPTVKIHGAGRARGGKRERGRAREKTQVEGRRERLRK